jgi:flagellar motor switch protein FliN
VATDPPSDDETVEAVEEAVDSPAFATLEPQFDSELTTSFGDEEDAGSGQLDVVFDVPVCLTVELGRTEVTIRDVVNLGRGSIIELDRGPGTPLDVRVNGVLIGRGEVVLINEEKLGLRFVEVVSQAERAKRLD